MRALSREEWPSHKNDKTASLGCLPMQAGLTQMEYKLAEHRFALAAAQREDLKGDFDELLGVIRDISDEDIIDRFEDAFSVNEGNGSVLTKSISGVINTLLDERLRAKGWLGQAPIFGDKRYREMRWTLDFAKATKGKGTFSVEVVFNNAGSLGWNLIKPVLACEQNHVSKAIETKVGIVILATKDLKSAGGFDNAIATFEEAPLYLSAMQNIISATPIIIIGLCAPKKFKVEHYVAEYAGGKRKKAGRIVRL